MTENTKSTSDESAAEPDLRPGTAKNATEEVLKDDRAQDYGESGQFAPGGMYNQHNVIQSDRIDLDEYTATRPKEDKK
jgi:hypothetical protein